MSMTLVNKYVVSGPEWNLNFFYLAVQVCLQNPIPALREIDADPTKRLS